MGVSIQITGWLEGERVIDRKLKGYERRMADVSPAWPLVDKIFHSIVEHQFATEGTAGGSKWPDLKERTQKDRERQGFGAAHPILQRTQRLKRSLTMLNADAISVHAPRYYARGSGVEYFVYHQSKKPRTRLPRRAPVELTADDRHALIWPVRLYVTDRRAPGAAVR